MNKRILSDVLAVILAAMLAATLFAAPISADGRVNIQQLVAQGLRGELAGGSVGIASGTAQQWGRIGIGGMADQMQGWATGAGWNAASGWGYVNPATGSFFQNYQERAAQAVPQYNLYTQYRYQASVPTSSFTAGWGAFNWPLVKQTIANAAQSVNSAANLLAGSMVPTEVLYRLPCYYNLPNAVIVP